MWLVNIFKLENIRRNPQILAGSTQRLMTEKKQKQNQEKNASTGKMYEMRSRCQKVPGITTSAAILIFTMADRGAIQANTVLAGKNVVLIIARFVMPHQLSKILKKKKSWMRISNAELSSAIRAWISSKAITELTSSRDRELVVAIMLKTGGCHNLILQIRRVQISRRFWVAEMRWEKRCRGRFW